MSRDLTAHLSRSGDLSVKVATLLHARLTLAQKRFAERVKASFTRHVTTMLATPLTPWDAWTAWSRYAVDFVQRSLLFWDTLRRRGNQFVAHTRAGLPPVLRFAHEMILDGRTFASPVNYALVRIIPPAGVTVDPGRRDESIPAQRRSRRPVGVQRPSQAAGEVPAGLGDVRARRVWPLHEGAWQDPQPSAYTTEPEIRSGSGRLGDHGARKQPPRASTTATTPTMSPGGTRARPDAVGCDEAWSTIGDLMVPRRMWTSAIVGRRRDGAPWDEGPTRPLAPRSDGPRYRAVVDCIHDPTTSSRTDASAGGMTGMWQGLDPMTGTVAIVLWVMHGVPPDIHVFIEVAGRWIEGCADRPQPREEHVRSLHDALA
jgi:hypothetical protein